MWVGPEPNMAGDLGSREKSGHRDTDTHSKGHVKTETDVMPTEPKRIRRRRRPPESEGQGRFFPRLSVLWQALPKAVCPREHGCARSGASRLQN